MFQGKSQLVFHILIIFLGVKYYEKPWELNGKPYVQHDMMIDDLSTL